MIYCIEIDRSGICEENMVLHYSFEKEPTRQEVLDIIEKEDCGYNDDYCRFTYHRVGS